MNTYQDLKSALNKYKKGKQFSCGILHLLEVILAGLI